MRKLDKIPKSKEKEQKGISKFDKVFYRVKKYIKSLRMPLSYFAKHRYLKMEKVPHFFKGKGSRIDYLGTNLQQSKTSLLLKLLSK